LKFLWKQYKAIAEANIMPVRDQYAEEIDYWRARLFSRILIVLVPFGFLAYLAGFIMSVIGKIPIVAIGDTIGFGLILFVFFNKRLRLSTKKNIVLICFYGLAFLLLIFIGSQGPGLLFLLAASVFSVLLFSSKTGYYSILINFILYCSLLLGLLTDIPGIPFFNDYRAGSWIAIGASFLLINLFIVYSVASLINGLQKTINNEKNLKISLREESLKLEKAKEEAEKSEKMKSAFLANMSHEIRTPLNSIVGFANILLSNKNHDEQKTYVDVITKSSNHLLDLVNDIIHFSKIDAGVITIENKPTNLVTFLNILGAAMKALCPAHLAFTSRFNIQSKNRLVLIDEQKLTQIITNLVTNAFKYTRHGKVELQANLNEEKSSIEFVIKDTGIGIPKEKHADVFERFFQENSTSEGVGLGLSIANSLVKALGGSIHFESEPGNGTTFYVSIPFLEYSKSDQMIEPVYEKTETRVRKNGSIHILVAEDNHENFELVNEILQMNHHKVSRALNGAEAVDMVRSNNFELVLMDIKMPEMDGYEATRKIREFNTHIPIIAVTAFAFHAEKQKALHAGCNEFINKPISVDELSGLVLKYSNLKHN
jgi:signal transduction histidine kinase/CheY-like chemotaxis protein